MYVNFFPHCGNCIFAIRMEYIIQTHIGIVTLIIIIIIITFTSERFFFIFHVYAFHVRIFLRLLVSCDCVSVSFDIRESSYLKVNGTIFNIACYEIVKHGTTFYY